MIVVKLLSKSFLLILSLSFLLCCTSDTEERKNLYQNNQKIGLWTYSIDSLDMRKEEFYGYSLKSDSSILQRERFYKDNIAFLEIFYSYLSIQDIDISDMELTDKLMPFLSNRLGFELFQTNCGSCHRAFPDEKSSFFIDKINDLNKTDELKSFLSHRKNIDEKLSLIHPSFNYLDSFEIENIIIYLNKNNDKTLIKD